MRWLPIGLVLSILCVSSPALPHGAGRDQYGCHHHLPAGGYHCHRGEFEGVMFESKEAMLEQLDYQRQRGALRGRRPSAIKSEVVGQVVGVADGDTITVMHGGVGEKIRLNGIDCPEKRQAFGTKAKQFASRLVFGKTVTVHVPEPVTVEKGSHKSLETLVAVEGFEPPTRGL